MPRIPVYEQQLTAQGVGAQPSARGVQVYSPMQGNVLAQGMANVASALDKRDQRDAQAWFDSFSSESQLKMYEYMDEAKKSAPAGAKGFYPAFMKKHDEFFMQAEENAPSEYAKELVRKQKAQSAVQFGRHALEFENLEGLRFRQEQVLNAVDMDAKAFDMMPADDVDGQLQATLSKWQARIEEEDYAPDVKAKILEGVKEKVTAAAMLRRINDDAQGTLKQIRPQKAGVDSFLNLTMEVEGGFTPSDGASGAPALFGINRNSYPQQFDEINAMYQAGDKAGAEAKAKEFYRKEIWEKNELGTLDPAAATVVADGLVNHWSGFQKKLLSAAREGATADELLQMRQDEYDRLVKSNPAKYENSYEGWMNRLDKVEAAAGAPSNDPTFNSLTYEQQQQFVGIAEREAARQQTKVRAEFESRLQDSLAMAQSDISAPRLTLPEFSAAYGDDAIRRYDDYLKDYEYRQNYGQALKMTPAQAQKMLEQKKPQQGKGYAAAQERYQNLQKAVAAATKERNSDPMGFAVQQELADPLDFQQDIIPQLKERAAIAASTQANYGAPYRVFAKGEADAMGDYLAKATPEQQLALSMQIGDVFGQKTPEVLGELAKKDRVFAHVAGLVNASPESQRVALDTLRGRMFVAQNPKAVNTKGFDAIFQGEVGNLYDMNPEAADALYKSAKSLFYVRQMAAGKAEDEASKDTIKTIVRDLLGADAIERNGQKTILPIGVEEDDFEDALEMMNGDDLYRFGNGYPTDDKGRTIEAESLADAKLHSIGAGKYLVSFDDGFVKSGSTAYILDLNKDKIDELLKR